MPKIVNHEQYRKELLSKCFDLFAEKGYGAITMRQIAEELRVSTGTLYHYFESKEVLFEQLVEELTQQDVSRAAVELEHATTLAARIEVGFDFIAKNEDYYIKQTLIWIDFYQQQGKEAVQQNEVFKRISKHGESAIADILGINDPTIVTFLLCLIDGLIFHRLFAGEDISFSAQAKLVAQMLTAYLASLPEKR